MATGQMNKVIQGIQKRLLVGEAGDGQLLERFLSGRDEAAFEAHVWRHGPMVWGVCRRVLSDYHDAEDAFQATFLVLVRKAASIVPREMVGNWLYGVAHQTALKARATAAKRRTRERQVVEMPEPEAVPQPDSWADLQPLLDRELSRLADKYRVAVVLCDLEGKTRKEAARQLGVPDGTLSARLARGRGMLAKRLARRGLNVSGGSLALVLAQHAAAAMPNSVASSAINAACRAAAGQVASVVSVEVAALTESVVRVMFRAKLRKLAAVVLFACACCGLALIGYQGIATGQAAIPGQLAETKDAPIGEKEKAPPLKDQPEAATMNTWSKPVNGLQGRLVQKPSRRIGGTEIVCVTLELENVSPRPLFFTTDPSCLDVDLFTSDGNKVPQAGVKRGGPIAAPTWGVIAPGSYVGFPLEYVALEIPKDRGALLPLQMNKDWLLLPGKYHLRGHYSAKPAEESTYKDVQRWAGKLELPPLSIEVKDRTK
jgi:RNA polymerase sigma factor (sigma-70 family)